MSAPIPTRQSSIASQQSGAASGGVDTISDEELVKLVNSIREEIRVLVLENEILEKTILRLEPALMHGVYQALEYATRMASSMSLHSSIRSHSSKFGLLSSTSRVSTWKADSVVKGASSIVLGTVKKINVLERAELVSTELGNLASNLEKVKKKAAKQQALLKAQLEETDNRVSGYEKATKLFNQNVIIEGWDKIAQRIAAEVWIKFMTDWTKITDSQIGKLRLRTSTLNTQYSKLKGQIKVKAELSESLRPVDFEKLNIENGECLKLIDQKVVQLGELKKLTGDANLNLTIHKLAMISQNNYLNKVLTSKKRKEQLTVELDKESDLIQVQVDVLAQRLNEIKKLRLAYQVPDIMEYVEVKWVVTDLKHDIKMLKNRVHIQQIALASINRKLQQSMASGMVKSISGFSV